MVLKDKMSEKAQKEMRRDEIENKDAYLAMGKAEPEQATKLGEWLLEHCDDEPSVMFEEED